MKLLKSSAALGLAGLLLYGGAVMADQALEPLSDGTNHATMTARADGDLRDYTLTTTAELRGDPTNHSVTFRESLNHARIRTGNGMFDGLYAMAVHEAVLNSVSQIKDGAYDHGQPIALDVFQTGEFWTYVWTRDLSYSVNLALGQFDPARSVTSLLFKTSTLKPSVVGGWRHQIIQDTGSGGSYPVSSDRVVWALGAAETLKFLSGAERENFLRQVYPILHDTIEQDRRLIFDPADGLYRGEQSFLDWREQTYPGWTKDNVLPIAMSKALSVNAADYFLLQTAAKYAGRLGHHDDEIRYARWAAELKDSINRRFYDPATGLYSTFLLSDGVHEIRVQRYDLLGESLAILLGVADAAQAKTVLENYPTGPYGPPVVWPEEQTVPIYHNQAIWPFVTAYWIKAARQAGDAAAADAGVRSLTRLAALNLSNMENYDFVSGRAEVKGQRLNGPVVDSRRQLWSVAGYLSMVQDVVFGLETTWDGIRFQPFITARLRDGFFANGDQIELLNFVYRGTTNQVRVHLPPRSTKPEMGVCPVARVVLNGQTVGGGFIPRADLQAANQWDIYLAAPTMAGSPGSLRSVDVANPRRIYGPLQPEWDAAQNGGITETNDRLTLHYRPGGAAKVVYDIYRDGELCARAVRGTNWTDPASGDFRRRVHDYAVCAVDDLGGNVSHLTPPRRFLDGHPVVVIPARDLENHGGNLVADDHFENWGKPGDTLTAKPFTVARGGRYEIRAKFSNGAGPVNTGITCGVKRLELRRAGSTNVVAAGYLVMPQSGDWRRWDWSSPVIADLSAGERYTLWLGEDDVSRNMSYLEQNERYTAWQGGGPDSYNFVNIAAFRLVNLTDDAGETAR